MEFRRVLFRSHWTDRTWTAPELRSSDLQSQLAECARFFENCLLSAQDMGRLQVVPEHSPSTLPDFTVLARPPGSSDNAGYEGTRDETRMHSEPPAKPDFRSPARERHEGPSPRS